MKQQKSKHPRPEFSTVYWIHNSEMTDPLTSGYVGVTLQYLTHRISKHKYDAFRPVECNKPISKFIRAMLKKDDLKVTVLFQGEHEECLELEMQYRPDINIGLNVYSGGGKGRKMNLTSQIHNSKERALEYHRLIREIRNKFKLSQADARKKYKELYGTSNERNTKAIRELAKERGISYSEARVLRKAIKMGEAV